MTSETVRQTVMQRQIVRQGESKAKQTESKTDRHGFWLVESINVKGLEGVRQRVRQDKV